MFYGMRLKKKKMEIKEEDWQKRTRLLIKDIGIEKLKNSTVAVIGVGGVGGYAAEMLVRSGVGHLIVLDIDTVNITNKNRQILALDSTIGKKKTDVIRERLIDINSELDLQVIDKYLTEENVQDVFCEIPKLDFLVDAIDTLSPKIALIHYCIINNIPLVSSMGVGAKYDATKVRISDLSKSYNCPLAYILRKKLRKIGISKGFNVVFSEELPDRDAIVPVEDELNKKSQVGTISYMPAVFGCVCAQEVVRNLLK